MAPSVDHHSVPAFIVRWFASADAVELMPPSVPHTVRTRELQRLADGGAYRAHRVCVIEKRRDPSENRLVSKPAANVCFRRHANSIRRYNEPIKDGLLKAALAPLLGLQEMDHAINSRSLQTIAAYASPPVKPDAIEDLLSNRIDSPFSPIARYIHEQQTIAPEHHELIVRFLSVAMARTPQWQDALEPVRRQTVRRALDQRPMAKKHLLDSLSPEEQEIAHIILDAHRTVLEDHTHLLLLADLAREKKGLLHFNTFKFLLLRSSGVPFVLGDNPASGYTDSLAGNLASRPRPGLFRADTVVTYPISPRCCVAVTSSPAFAGSRFPGSVVVADDVVRKINTAMLELAYEHVVLPHARTSELFIPGVQLDSYPEWPHP